MLNRQGDIYLVPDLQYFASNPDLHNLISKLAQLRLHLRAGLYMLLLLKQNVNYKIIQRYRLSYKKAVTNLENRF